MSLENSAGLGVLSNYGPRAVEEKYGGVYISNDEVKRAQWIFDYDDLPVGSTSGLELSIPAGASIVSAKMEVVEAFTSTSTLTDLLIGLEQADGTDIDLDGLIQAAQATQTAIGTVGNIVVGAGALVNASIGAAAGELIVTASAADLLTGKGRVIVEYVA